MNNNDYNEPAPLSDQEIANILLIVRASRIWISTFRPTRAAALVVREGDPLPLRFDYRNWRRSVNVAVMPDVGEGNHWLLHAYVSTRDGLARSEMVTRRRTFIIANLRNLDWVADHE